MTNRARVLLGDDSACVRSIQAQALQGLDIELFEADTGNSVIRALNLHKPDLLVLDISMPSPDGLTLLKKIREDEEFCDLPVIICSVEGDARTQSKSYALGIEDFITKPFNMKYFHNVVRDIIAKRKEI